MEINWKSRKFWISVAAMLMSIGTSISGLVIEKTDLTVVGTICTVLAGGIYAFVNAYQTGKVAMAEAMKTQDDGITFFDEPDDEDDGVAEDEGVEK